MSLSQALEMLLGESSPRVSLKVFLERDGLGLVPECDCGLHTPGTELVGMGYVPGVVNLEPFGEILGQADIVMVRIVDTSEHVDIPELTIHGGYSLQASFVESVG
jgi:hypothetical protein